MRQMPYGEKEEEPHMKTKRILSLLMAGALLTGALTGCGSKKDDSAQSGDNSGVITINYPTFQCGTNTSAPVCDELIKEFNEKYAGKYEIKKEDVPGDQNYIDKIKVQLGTGDLPPVIYGGGYNLLDMVVAKGLAVDLTDAVNSDADWKALYSDTALATNSRDGKIYASSMEGQVIGYFYNKDLFKQAGITEPAKTWDEFFQQCDKLKAAGITPLAIGGSVGGNLAGLLGSVAPTFWTDEGAKYDLGDSLKDGTFDFDTYATELYEYLATWMKKGYINEDVLTLDAAGAQQMLGSGEAAFMVRGTDNITVARQYYPDANMGVLPLPSSADGAPSFRVGEGDAWGVWKDTENEAACWALLDYLARPEVGSKWATVSGALPTVEGADAADVYTLNCYKQAVEDCNGKVQYDNLFDRKFFPSGMWGIMADSMSMMLSNPDDVTEAVEYLRDNYLELYAEQNG